MAGAVIDRVIVLVSSGALEYNVTAGIIFLGLSSIALMIIFGALICLRRKVSKARIFQSI